MSRRVLSVRVTEFVLFTLRRTRRPHRRTQYASLGRTRHLETSFARTLIVRPLGPHADGLDNAEVWDEERSSAAQTA